MSPTLTLEKSSSFTKYKHSFLDELIDKIRLIDTYEKYQDLSDDSLLEELISALNSEVFTYKNLNLHPLHQFLTSAFYQAIGDNIERLTGHRTETYVHVRNKEFSSAVIFCGGVLVLNSLISGYQSLKSISLQELVEMAENNIHDAVIKASYYLDF
ncbi:MAG: DUF269 domain-containing protein [Cyanobacteria bacterium P01_G01_bin.19]